MREESNRRGSGFPETRIGPFLCICLAVARLSCGTRDFRCVMWDLALRCVGPLVCDVKARCSTRGLATLQHGGS